VRKFLILFILIGSLVGCASIKPMEIPRYNAPNLSSIKRPEIPVPQEGKDYTIDLEKNTVTYTISGQDLLAAKVISEKVAWIQIEMLLQMVNLQSQIIFQKDELIITIDIQRQYADRGKTHADVKAIISEVIAIIAIALRFVK